jgi:hypothetical protein
MYPNTAEHAAVDGDSKFFMEDVAEEARAKADEFAEYSPTASMPWEAHYDYWRSRYTTATIKRSVSVKNPEKLPHTVLRVETARNGENFVCEGLVGLSEKAFEPIQTTTWERREHAPNVSSRIEALNDLKTLVSNLELDFDELSKQMHDLALFDFYVNNLMPGRADELLKELNGGELKEGEYIKTISKHIDAFWGNLIEEEKAEIAGKEKILFVAKAYTKNSESVEGMAVTTGVDITLGNVPCRIDEKGVFTLDLDNSTSYQVETYSTTKIEKETTPTQLAKIKLRLDKKSDGLTKGTNTERARYKVE